MKANERRKNIVNILLSNNTPVSGSTLAQITGVSRQIIVQDIATLKSSGYDILSTHNGYIILSSPLCERVFKVRHTSAETEDELSCIVSLGGTIVDVFVWHKVYGKIVASLNIFSQISVKTYMEGIRAGKSTELLHITAGYHYHTIRADSNETLDKIHLALEQRKYIAPEI